MRIVLQRVLQAQVSVSGEVVGSIGKGILLLVGVTHADTPQTAEWLAQKCIHLRLFHDVEGKMNRSLLDEKGEMLIISQFTLYGDCSEGRRPSFTKAARPAQAEPLYNHVVDVIRSQGIPVQTGRFGADMQVALTNDGPVTLFLEY